MARIDILREKLQKTSSFPKCEGAPRSVRQILGYTHPAGSYFVQSTFEMGCEQIVSKLIDKKKIVEVMEKSWLIRNNQDLIMERLIREWGNLKGFPHSLLPLIKP